MATFTTSGSPTFNGDGSCTIDSTGTDRVYGPAALLTNAQGWVAARVKMGWAYDSPPSVAPKIFFYDIASGGYVHGIYETTGQDWRIQRFNGTSDPGTLDVSDTFASGDKRTVIFAWTSSNVLFSLNGGAFSSAAGGTVPVASPNSMDIGSDRALAHWIASDLYWVVGGTGTLTDANASTLNAYGDSDPSWPGFGTPTFLWPATSADYQTGPAVRTYKRLYGPAQLTGSAADLYTCPASTVARTLHIHASNPSGSPVDVNLSIGTDAAGTRVWDDLEIPVDSVEDVFDPYELAAGEKIQGWASTAGTVVVTITGHEDPA